MAFDATTFEVDPQSLTTPRERLEYLRDFLRRLPAERFDMTLPGAIADASVGYCGTPACIAGWSAALFRRAWRHPLEETGIALFGLPEAVAHGLFYPGISCMADGRPGYDAEPADAATVIDHLLNTGEVDWSVARKAEAA